MLTSLVVYIDNIYNIVCLKYKLCYDEAVKVMASYFIFYISKQSIV